LWKFAPDITGKKCYKWLYKQTNSSTTYEYNLEFDGSYLQNDLKATIDDLCIADSDMLLIENHKSDRYSEGRWNLSNDDVPSEG